MRGVKEGAAAGRIWTVLGGFAVFLVVLLCLPFSVPRLLGYSCYVVSSGSMEPEIPIGSVIYVKPAEPEGIREGDVIAFQSGDSVIAHRVVRNQKVEGTFKTKGDANAGEDMNDVGYAALIGQVTAHYPLLGQMLVLYTSNIGKAYAVCFAACGAMLNILAGRLRERARAKRLPRQ